MSWYCSGVVDVTSENADLTLQWTPDYLVLDRDSKAQADFVLDVIRDAASKQLLDGRYTTSMSGHTSSDPEHRKAFSLSLKPL